MAVIDGGSQYKLSIFKQTDTVEQVFYKYLAMAAIGTEYHQDYFLILCQLFMTERCTIGRNIDCKGRNSWIFPVFRQTICLCENYLILNKDQRNQ